MSPRDWFGLVVRVLGLVAVITSPFYVLSAITLAVQATQMAEASVLGYLIYGAVMALFGSYFLRGMSALGSFRLPRGGTTPALEEGSISPSIPCRP